MYRALFPIYGKRTTQMSHFEVSHVVLNHPLLAGTPSTNLSELLVMVFGIVLSPGSTRVGSHHVLPCPKSYKYPTIGTRIG